MADYNPNKSDSISIAESLTLEIPRLDLAINNSISIAEDISDVWPPYDLTTYDSVSIAEDNSWNLVINEYQFDSIIIAEWEKEDIWHVWADLYINIIEYVSIADTESSIVQCYYYGFDSITIAESQAYGLSLIVLSTSDSISISDVEQLYEFPLYVYDNIYIRDLFVKAIADADVAIKADTIAAPQTVLASATRTVGITTSNAFKVSSTLFIRWYFDVTAEAGTSTLDIILQTSPDNIVWYDAVTADQISATGQYTTTLTEPGIYVRAKCTVAGTSFTFSVKMVKHMPVRRFERRRSGRRRSFAKV